MGCLSVEPMGYAPPDLNHDVHTWVRWISKSIHRIIRNIEPTCPFSKVPHTYTSMHRYKQHVYIVACRVRQQRGAIKTYDFRVLIATEAVEARKVHSCSQITQGVLAAHNEKAGCSECQRCSNTTRRPTASTPGFLVRSEGM